MSTDGVRENILFVMLVVGIMRAVCNIIYEVVIGIAPWMSGKSIDEIREDKVIDRM